MKKRINLLVKQEKYKNIEEFFQVFRWVLVGLVVVFFLMYGFFFAVLSRQRSKLDQLLKEKQALLEYLLNNKDVEAKFVYFSGKYSQVTDILEQDVNFYPYYSLLNESLKSASPEPSLSSLMINKDKTTTFTLAFTDLSSLVSFLKFTESDLFLKSFDELTLISFASAQKTSGGAKKTATYQLNFKGKFKLVP